MSVLSDNETGAVVHLPENVRNVLKNIAECEKYTNYKIVTENNSNSGDNYLSTILFAKIHGIKLTEDGNENEIINLIIKLPFLHIAPKNVHPVTAYFCREKFVYTEFFPQLLKLQENYNIPISQRIHFAKCYAAISKCEEELLVLENLNEKQYKMYDRCKGVDYEHVMLIIKNIAQFHALTFALKYKHHEFNENAKTYAFHKTDFSQKFPVLLAQCKQKAIDCITDDTCKEKLKSFCSNLQEKFYNLLDMNDDEERPYNVFCHGDLWINNILFKYEEQKPTDMIMVDWQMFKYASPVTDLAYFLFTCTDEAFRADYLDEAFNAYYSTLRERLLLMDCDPNKCYPEEVFRQQLKEKLAYGLVIGIIIVPLIVISKKDADVDNWSQSKANVGFANAKYNERTVERLNGVVQDMIRLNLI